MSVIFITKKGGVISPSDAGRRSYQPSVTKNLGFRSEGEQVTFLQSILLAKGYMEGRVTGYFGIVTLKAVKAFQKANGITATGFVGPLTRKALTNPLAAAVPSQGEYFQGKVEAFSTDCFADGICSVTVDGKKITIIRGWAQEVVGALKGVESISDLDTKIGHQAKVYAKKTGNSYTLYGSDEYYVDVQ